MKAENPAALRFIIEDDVFLLQTDKPKPEIPLPSVAKTPEYQLNYSGLYKKKFLVIVHYPDHEFIATDHFTALQNILKRKEYNINDDVAIFNLAKYSIDVKQLLDHFDPQKLLLLGEKSIPANMEPLVLNQHKKMGDCTILYSFSFDEMMDNTDHKKTFWEPDEKFMIVPQLVFATNNLHKLQEATAKMERRVQILSLNYIDCTDEIAETGTTFRQNASIKSNHIYKKYKINCFADDSGLEIDALNGEPGVYSARYAGGQGDAANIAKVLRELGTSTNRNARFRTVISLIWNGDEHFFEGHVEGTIRMAVSGSGGFGYDPVFEPDGYAVTFAEMTLDEKNSISHRSMAIEKLINFLDRN